MTLPLLHLYDSSSGEFSLRLCEIFFFPPSLTHYDPSIYLSFASPPPFLADLRPGRQLRLRDAMHCPQSSSGPTRLHADQFTQVIVLVPDGVEMQAEPLPSLTLPLFDELVQQHGATLVQALCMLRGIITTVLKNSALVSCCRSCERQLAEWFTVETDGMNDYFFFFNCTPVT